MATVYFLTTSANVFAQCMQMCLLLTIAHPSRAHTIRSLSAETYSRLPRSSTRSDTAGPMQSQMSHFNECENVTMITCASRVKKPRFRGRVVDLHRS